MRRSLESLTTPTPLSAYGSSPTNASTYGRPCATCWAPRASVSASPRCGAATSLRLHSGTSGTSLPSWRQLRSTYMSSRSCTPSAWPDAWTRASCHAANVLSLLENSPIEIFVTVHLFDHSQSYRNQPSHHQASLDSLRGRLFGSLLYVLWKHIQRLQKIKCLWQRTILPLPYY